MYKSTTTIEIKSTPENVWDALINPVKVKKYFFDTNMEIDLKVGGNIFFRGLYEGTEYTDKGIITEVIENKVLEYNYRSSWDTTEDIIENYLPVRFEIENIGDATTKLTIIQTQNTLEKKEHSNESRKVVLGGLKSVCELEL